MVEGGLRATSAWVGLCAVFRQAVKMSVACRGLRDVAFSSSYGPQHHDALRDVVAPRLEQLLIRARSEGSLRPDIAADLIMLILMLTEFAQRSSQVQPDAYQRYLELFISSLRSDSHQGTSLGITLDEDQAQAIAGGWA